VQQQLSFRLQELPSTGKQWSLEIPRTVFEDSQLGRVEAPVHLCSDFSWKGNVSVQGKLFRLQGAWRVELIRQCVRCNVDFPMVMEGECDRYFQLGDPERESEASDMCECLAPPGVIDLLDLLREELWLAWKPMVVCSESCKGLCPQCGENLNRHECNCSQHDENHPFAALRKIRFDT